MCFYSGLNSLTGGLSSYDCFVFIEQNMLSGYFLFLKSEHVKTPILFRSMAQIINWDNFQNIS